MKQEFYHTHKLHTILLSLICLASVCVLCVLSIHHHDKSHHESYLAPIVILAIIAAVAGGLEARLTTRTVVLDNGSLSGRFGLGLVQKEVMISEIESVQIVKNPWYACWGYHVIGPRGGRDFRFSGYDAVVLRLRDGSSLRIDTDETVELAAALNIGEQKQIITAS